ASTQRRGGPRRVAEPPGRAARRGILRSRAGPAVRPAPRPPPPPRQDAEVPCPAASGDPHSSETPTGLRPGVQALTALNPEAPLGCPATPARSPGRGCPDRFGNWPTSFRPCYGELSGGMTGRRDEGNGRVSLF